MVHAPGPDDKPRLLFLTPVLPGHGGNGLCMRAALFLDALSPLFEVFVHVIAVFPTPRHGSPGAARRPGGRRVVVHPVASWEDARYRMIAQIGEPRLRLAALAGYPKPLLCRFATDAAVADVQDRYAGVRFDAVHVFRLYLAPFAAPFLDGTTGCRPICRLDLDDYESRTHRRAAELYATNGEQALAYLEHAEAAKYERLEDTWLPQFNVVYTASDHDQAELVRRYGSPVRFVHAPNAVRLSARPPNRGAADGPYTLLFVGSLSYYPNEDAALLLCREILPRVRERMSDGAEVKLVIAGALPSAAVRALAQAPGVTVMADVPDLAPLYRKADLVVAPLRAGGGTRIKILEAFGHRRPVVSTAIGAEGLNARHGEHLLIAETPAALADACVALLQQPARAAALARQAFALVQSAYDCGHVQALIRRTIQAG